MGKPKKPRCYLQGCGKPVEHWDGYFHSKDHAAVFGHMMAEAKGRSWCPPCRAWVMLPEAFHNLLRHGRLEVS